MSPATSAKPHPFLPVDPAAHRVCAEARQSCGDALGAAAHRAAADALAGWSAESTAGPALSLYNIATGYLMTGAMETAGTWYRLALRVDPGLVIAHQNLAAIYQRLGFQEDAERHRIETYGRQRVFVEPGSANESGLRILVLCTGLEGNTPFEALVPAGRTHRIKYFIDYADPNEDAALPPYDVVFNAIGEPDLAAPLSGRIAQFISRCNRPLLNLPDHITRTARQRLPALLAGIEDVAIAPCMRLDVPPPSVDTLSVQLEDEQVGFPAISRPIATHGGEGVLLHAGPDELWHRLDGAEGSHYVTRFVDTRCADGYYRKYRMILVDRKPYPYHCAISPDWLVHYFSADMMAHPWKIEEERRFLEDPAAVLGARAMAAIEAIAARLDLDFGGIDFTCLGDGRVLVFEANATMLVHFERPDGPLAHKNAPVGRIIEAFQALQAKVVAG